MTRPTQLHAEPPDTTLAAVGFVGERQQRVRQAEAMAVLRQEVLEEVVQEVWEEVAEVTGDQEALARGLLQRLGGKGGG